MGTHGNQQKRNHERTCSQHCILHRVTGKIVRNTLVLQYYLDRGICRDVDEIEFKVEPHGNLKSSDSLFHSIKKSTLQDIGHRVQKGNENASCIHSSGIGRNDQGDFGDNPRSKKQIYNKARSIPGVGKVGTLFEVESILAYNAELDEQEIV